RVDGLWRTNHHPDIQRPRARVKSDVVRVRADLHATRLLQRDGVVDLERAELAVGDADLAVLLETDDALRLLQAGDALQVPPRRGVEDLEFPVPERGDEEAGAAPVEREVVDAAFDLGQGDRRLEMQRGLRLLRLH